MCAKDDTFIILAGAEDIILSSNNVVSKKWPKWFTPNCISNPSSVFDFGQPAIPVKINYKCIKIYHNNILQLQ